MADNELEELAAKIERDEDEVSVPEQLVLEPPPEDEETKSLYTQIHEMTVGQRIKLALKGNREARQLLLRDSNRVVQRFVLQNPRLTDDEVVMVCKNRNTDTDILRLIGDHREWMRNYQVKHALVQNPKTPIATALHFVPGLMERDIRLLAKSKNVPSVIVSRARRLLIDRGK